MTVPEKIASLRQSGKPIVALTAYDYPMARLIDESGAADLILVGDSVGMVFAGCEDTTSVTMDQMVYHTQVVRRGVKKALLVADLPYQSYEDPEQAVANARRLIEAGAEAVKLEGGAEVIGQVRAILAEDIPVLGHIGMLPQHVREDGGYKKKGKTEAGARRLMEDARLLDEAGVFAAVLEGIVPSVTAEITAAAGFPTIGIGSGTDCGGQIAVIHDVVGYFPWFCPPFIQPKADVAAQIQSAVKTYADEVRSASS